MAVATTRGVIESTVERSTSVTTTDRLTEKAVATNWSRIDARLDSIEKAVALGSKSQVEILNRLHQRETEEPKQKDKSERSFLGFLKAIKNTRYPDPGVRKAASRTLYETYGVERESFKGSGVVKAAMGEESGTIGGYLVPQDFSYRLLETVGEVSIIYPRANVIPMLSAETYCPKVDAETVQTAGTSPFFGGVKFTWGSSQTPTETEPAFRQVMLKAWDLLGYCTVANPWLEDTNVRGEEYLLKLLGKAAAWYAELAFFQGTGAAQQMPLGILNGPGKSLVSRQTGSSVTIQDISKMAAKLLPYSWSNAIWATHPTCLEKIMQITQFYINVEANPEGGQAGSLLTRPLFITEKLPALGTTGDLVLFDPSLYVIGERQQVLIDVSEHTLFRNQQTVFRVWMRLDGKPQLSSTITLQDASTVVSAYVILN